jgi:transcriptional regulator with XRE-family HTH domain
MTKRNRTRQLAEKLRAARIGSGLSQRETAQCLDRPQSYISRCESGARRIDVFELEEFARVYGKPLLFFVESVMPESPAQIKRTHLH